MFTDVQHLLGLRDQPDRDKIFEGKDALGRERERGDVIF